MALALRTMVIPTATDDALYSYAGSKPRREWTVHLQVRERAAGRGAAGPGPARVGAEEVAGLGEALLCLVCRGKHTHTQATGACWPTRHPTTPTHRHHPAAAGGRGPGGRQRARV